LAKKRAAVEGLKLRKRPRQKRSENTVAVIVEAAARILERYVIDAFPDGCGISRLIGYAKIM
jgi:hypothetical protein